MVTNKVSQVQHACVSIQRVPVNGVIDTGADIMWWAIWSGGCSCLAKRISVNQTRHHAHLRLRAVSSWLLHWPRHLVSMKRLWRPRYMWKWMPKISSLLSEGVCRQLSIITYHHSVQPPILPDKNTDAEALVTTVWVQLLQSIRLLANQGAVVPVCCEGNLEKYQQPLLVKAAQEFDDPEKVWTTNIPCDFHLYVYAFYTCEVCVHYVYT